MLGLRSLTESSTLINEPFNLKRRNLSSQFKESSAAGIELRKVWCHAHRLRSEPQQKADDLEDFIAERGAWSLPSSSSRPILSAITAVKEHRQGEKGLTSRVEEPEGRDSVAGTLNTCVEDQTYSGQIDSA